MDRLTEIREKLEELTGDFLYTKEELKTLEAHFGRKIEYAFPGFIGFADGKDRYWRHFSSESEEVMLSVAEKRIESLKQLAARIDACKTDEEVMAICAGLMMDYARSWKDVDARSREAEHEKRTMLSIQSIEVKEGRLMRERSNISYSAIVLEPYYGSVIVRRQDDGRYRVTKRVPLCGESDGTYDSLHLKKCMISFMRFIG